ncbi:MAG: cell wall hydrolase [Lachnospiraceae bacterium]|nr:cell wall hydrolase [Lachnospiraceae bacterium]
MKRFVVMMLVSIMLVVTAMPTMKAKAASTADEWYNITMASMRAKVVNGTDGNDIAYSATWYSGLSEVEVLARLLYAEAPWWIADKKCVAMVLWNRVQVGWYASTLYGVAVQNGQFATITGSVNETAGARIVDIESASWQNALRYACTIYVTGTTNPKWALGISEFSYQRDFRSFLSFNGKAYDLSGEPHINIDGTEYGIYDIYIPVHGYFETVAEAVNQYLSPSNAENNLPYYADGEGVNIYFGLE